MACEHKNLKHGYEKTYDATWCLECGTITHASDGLIGPGLHRRQDWSDWINVNLTAWSCRNEAHDGKRCAQWCGGEPCPAAIRKAMSEVQPQILTDDSLKRLGARLATLLDDDQCNNIEPLLVTIKDEQAADLAKMKAEREELGWALDAQNAVNIDLHAELFKAKEYATALAVSMHRQHYVEAAPNWQPLDDLMGLLTQIDNMYAGLRNDFADLKVENKRLVGMNLARIKAERDAAVALLRRYRNETPLGHQPHMIAHEVDALLAARKEGI